ncbi:uncharacterized protein [Procambarus clarkii]|uniref:uncharacterized protein n=1 Tax=Procambarus clarkii TaxID=6728 RepID=UPI001E6709BD|nr:uncharacterized protein LOC123775144 [Procambarus clarkii]
MLSPLEEADLACVIAQLEALKYNGLETLEPSWVHSVLVTPGAPRQSLLTWALIQLFPLEAAELATAPQHVHTPRILQCFSCMGICKAGDSDVIQGTAPAPAQLKFWRRCLDNVRNLQESTAFADDKRVEPQASNALLDQLAYSPHLQPILKGGGTSLIPGDLQEKYRTWCKYGQYIPLGDLLQDSHDQLAEQLKKYNNIEEQWKVKSFAEQQSDLHTDLNKQVPAFTKELGLFQGVYSLYIAPWTTSSTKLELPDTGPLVHDATGKLAKLIQALKSTEEALQKCEELGEQEKLLERHGNCPSVTSSLQSLLTQPSLNKLVQNDNMK